MNIVIKKLKITKRFIKDFYPNWESFIKNHPDLEVITNDFGIEDVIFPFNTIHSTLTIFNYEVLYLEYVTDEKRNIYTPNDIEDFLKRNIPDYINYHGKA